MNPDGQAHFIFDNATTHQKWPDDALSALQMPLNLKIWKPKTKPADFRMCDTVLPDGTPQSLYWPDDHQEMPGHFKGMKQLLIERGLWQSGLRAQCGTSFKCHNHTGCCACSILYSEPDFVGQKSALVELIEDRGHLCDYYPKFHCELNFIEQYWGAAKYHYRATPPTSNIDKMETNVTACLDDVPLVQMRRYTNFFR
jgi:hypothetical protein